jgi:enoyl-CoA hydratase/carnithine racemase
MELSAGGRVAVPAVLTAAGATALADDITRAVQDDAVGMVWLEGGVDVFCRGMDIDAIAAGAAGFEHGVQEFANMLCLLAEAAKPTVAVVRGTATGGGLGLAAVCDFVIAARTATFALPEALFGLTPAVITPVLLERISPPQLRRMVLTAAPLDADQALSIGLVDEVLDAPALAPRIRRLTTTLARVDAGAKRTLAQVMARHRVHSLRESVQWGVAETTRAAGSPEVGARVRRFLEGGAPWQA